MSITTNKNKSFFGNIKSGKLEIKTTYQKRTNQWNCKIKYDGLIAIGVDDAAYTAGEIASCAFSRIIVKEMSSLEQTLFFIRLNNAHVPPKKRSIDECYTDIV